MPSLAICQVLSVAVCFVLTSVKEAIPSGLDRAPHSSITAIGREAIRTDVNMNLVICKDAIRPIVR